MDRTAHTLAGGLLLLSLSLAPLRTTAGEPALLEAIGGIEAGGTDRSYAFLTGGWGASLGPGLRLPLRLTASDLRYSFASGGATTDVHAPGATLLAGLSWEGSRGRVAVLGGGEVRRERRSVRGSAAPATSVLKPGAVAQVEGDLAFGGRLRAFALANYAGAARYAYGRLALLWQLTNLRWEGARAWFVGLEGVAQGNAETRAAQAGGMLQVTFARVQFSIGLHAGVEQSRSPGGPSDHRPYGALSLYQRY